MLLSSPTYLPFHGGCNMNKKCIARLSCSARVWLHETSRSSTRVFSTCLALKTNLVHWKMLLCIQIRLESLRHDSAHFWSYLCQQSSQPKFCVYVCEWLKFESTFSCSSPDQSINLKCKMHSTPVPISVHFEHIMHLSLVITCSLQCDIVFQGEHHKLSWSRLGIHIRVREFELGLGNCFQGYGCYIQIRFTCVKHS